MAGWPAFAVDGRSKCAEHLREAARARPSTGERGYGSRWQRTSRRYLRTHRTCEAAGCGRASAEVDHIDGLGPLGPRGYDESNFRALCKPHHSSKTARDTGFGRRR